jgi:osmotically-inducible protein OsmY
MSPSAPMNARRSTRLSPALLAASLMAVIVVSTQNGCAPMVVAAGVGAGALVATDRRSTGAQVDDETIEVKIATTAGNRWGDAIHLNVTSYNGIVLLTGEAPNANVLGEITNLARTTDRVKTVHNEMTVGPTTALPARTNDTYITSKVKAGFVEANKFAATRVKVVTERSVVYLMGIVNRDEADAATRIASTTSGVARVVRLFEYSS